MCGQEVQTAALLPAHFSADFSAQDGGAHIQDMLGSRWRLVIHLYVHQLPVLI